MATSNSSTRSNSAVRPCGTSPSGINHGSAGAGGGNAPRIPDQEVQAKSRLDKWEPAGPCQDVCNGRFQADRIVSVGVTQNTHFLLIMWNAFLGCCKDKPEGFTEDPEIVDAFVQAFALCIRRCPAALSEPILQLIETTRHLPVATCIRLAHLVSELGEKEPAFALLRRTSCAVPANNSAREDTTAAAEDEPKDGPLPLPFYLSLLRLATETLTPPDMGLAIDVVDRLEAAGIAHNAMTLKQVCVGLSRMVEPPVDVAVRILRYRERTREDVEACLLNGIFNVLDSAVGAEAKLAGDAVRSLSASVVHGPVADVVKECPTLLKEGCFVADCTTYMLVDPMTTNLSAAAIPDKTYMLFLYSSIRALVNRRNNVCSANPINRKIDDVERLLSSSKQAVVVPYETELLMRACLPPNADRPGTPQERLLCFARITRSAQCEAFRVHVVSGDMTVIRGCNEYGVPVRSQMGGPLVGGAMSSGQQTAAARGWGVAPCCPSSATPVPAAGSPSPQGPQRRSSHGGGRSVLSMNPGHGPAEAATPPAGGTWAGNDSRAAALPSSSTICGPCAPCDAEEESATCRAMKDAFGHFKTESSSSTPL